MTKINSHAAMAAWNKAKEVEALNAECIRLTGQVSELTQAADDVWRHALNMAGVRVADSHAPYDFSLSGRDDFRVVVQSWGGKYTIVREQDGNLSKGDGFPLHTQEISAHWEWSEKAMRKAYRYATFRGHFWAMKISEDEAVTLKTTENVRSLVSERTEDNEITGVCAPSLSVTTGTKRTTVTFSLDDDADVNVEVYRPEGIVLQLMMTSADGVEEHTVTEHRQCFYRHWLDLAQTLAVFAESSYDNIVLEDIRKHVKRVADDEGVEQGDRPHWIPSMVIPRPSLSKEVLEGIQPWLRKQFEEYQDQGIPALRSWELLGRVGRLWAPNLATNKDVVGHGARMDAELEACINGLVDNLTLRELFISADTMLSQLVKSLASGSLKEWGIQEVFEMRDALESIAWVLSNAGHSSLGVALETFDQQVVKRKVPTILRDSLQEVTSWVNAVWHDTTAWWAIPTDSLRMEVELMEMEEEQNE